MDHSFLRSILLAVVLALTAGGAIARAGGGPENVFLVVNSASWASQAVANQFIELRQIPPGNVHYIEWTGGCESVDGETLRTKILIPTLDMIEKRGLLQQIDYVIYSSDFPYAIDLSKDFPNVKFADQGVPFCSVTSATYFWNLVLSKIPNIMELQSNFYMRMPAHRSTKAATLGFRSWYGWNAQGELLEAGGQPYMLSTMLAVTSGRGNSVREAISYLQRSATADGTRPKGTVYFCKTDDIRSTKRAPEFKAAVEELEKLGVRAKVINNPMPSNRPDVIGAMLGTPSFSWPSSHSKILPGAICENFTSFGGAMSEGSPQTPLSELLRYGAAGSSGTIIEPYAIQEKFPSPQIHVHYARGSTLAEAFYQSVHGPAHLLLVGDPLCRPWADIPVVQVAGVKPNDKVSGTLTLKATARFPHGGTSDRFELFIDGRRVAADQSGGELVWDSKSESDGYHELRVVAIEQGPVQSQGRSIIPITVNNHGQGVEFSLTPLKTVRWGESLTAQAKCRGAARIYLVHNNRILGAINGEHGEATINPRQLATGPVSVQALALLADKGRGYTSSAPVTLTVEPPTPLPALKDAPTKLLPGMSLKLADDKVVVVEETREASWPALAGVKPNTAFQLQGFFDVAADDMYQFQVWHYGDLKLTVDNSVLLDGHMGNYTQKFLPIALTTGRHRLTVSGVAGSSARLRILFGGPGAMSLNGQTFQHSATPRPN